MAVDSLFRVIVVGGGPVGLTAAHALSRAGIEYIVLEHRSSIAVDVGASLVLWPQGLRVLAQLGLVEQLRRTGADLHHTLTVTLEAHKYKEDWAPRTIKKNHGTSSVVFHRADLLKVLYESLSKTDKARVLTNKKVINITTNESGVEVRCADGTVYKGSIVIGADGAHSTVGQIMRELAVRYSKLELNEEKPYVSEYRALWCTFPRQPGFETGDAFETHGTDVSLQFLNSHDRSWIFIYERLNEPTRERVSYSESDVEALATRWGDLPIGEKLRVKDIFSQRYTAGMANLEEGIVQHWSWDRIVLVGDACHKLTPNQGLGYNNGIQDVVALVNELHRSMAAHHSGGGSLSRGVLTSVFARYQSTRMELLQKDYKASASYTRMSAWRNWMLWFLDRYIFSSIPGFDDFALTWFVAGLISKSPILDFVESEEPFQGKVPWKHAMKSPSVKSAA
ncbi:hypothetical protein V1527DRAFT_477760 [Lipomyces starkeyi]